MVILSNVVTYGSASLFLSTGTNSLEFGLLFFVSHIIDHSHITLPFIHTFRVIKHSYHNTPQINTNSYIVLHQNDSHQFLHKDTNHDNTKNAVYKIDNIRIHFNIFYTPEINPHSINNNINQN